MQQPARARIAVEATEQDSEIPWCHEARGVLEEGEQPSGVQRIEMEEQFILYPIGVLIMIAVMAIFSISQTKRLCGRFWHWTLLIDANLVVVMAYGLGKSHTPFEALCYSSLLLWWFVFKPRFCFGATEGQDDVLP